jgi:OmpA-OmpF porin, OOP family
MNLLSPSQLKRTLLKTALIVFSFAAYQQANAQLAVKPTDDKYIAPKDTATHKQWRKGKHQFPGRPRDMWQVGLGGGSFLISGDVKSQFGWGSSIHVRKSLGYILSLKLEYMFGQARGLNYQASDAGAYPQIAPFPITRDGQTVITPGKYGLSDPFYMNFKMGQWHAASAQMVVNINNIAFHRPSNKWSLNAIFGVGLAGYNTRYDALDKNGLAYDFSNVANGLDVTKVADRQTVRDNTKGILDGDYETLALQNRRNILWAGNATKSSLSLAPFVNTGMSLEFLVTPRLSIALEHQVIFTGDDYLDGFIRQVQGVLTPNSDVGHYTSVRLGFHIGSKEKRIQPLWFINPLLSSHQDIADLKKNMDEDWFKDTDEDGVPNKTDKEPNTEPGAIVDVKGRIKDSDGDGKPDHLDKEPFSPPGYPVDENGVAQTPKPIFPTDIKQDGNKLVIGNETYEPKFKGDGAGGNGSGTIKDWYLPMIHFNTDQYAIRSEAYPQLQHVAEVMQKYTDIKVAVHGHTDSRASDEYNDMLSYNRAMTAIDFLVNQYQIDRSRFIVLYNGKRSNLVSRAKGDQDHFMNRRVEFYVATGKEKTQTRPAVPKERSNWKY